MPNAIKIWQDRLKIYQNTKLINKAKILTNVMKFAKPGHTVRRFLM